MSFCYNVLQLVLARPRLDWAQFCVPVNVFLCFAFLIAVADICILRPKERMIMVKGCLLTTAPMNPAYRSNFVDMVEDVDVCVCVSAANSFVCDAIQWLSQSPR